MPFEPAPKTEEQQRVQMGRIALEAIAAHILTVPPDKFYMGAWRCTTAACAIGHGIALPEVRATGLRLVPGDELTDGLWPKFDGVLTHNSYAHVGAAFGISPRVAETLFSMRDEEIKNTTAAVSARIRAHLARTA